MSGSLTLAWDERLTGYDFGPGHPLAPVRVELTIALAREFGLQDHPHGGHVIVPDRAGMIKATSATVKNLTSLRGVSLAIELASSVRSRALDGIRRTSHVRLQSKSR